MGVGAVPGQLLLTVWPQYDQLGTEHGEDVHLLLPAALHPRAAAQHHRSLGPLQTHKVHVQTHAYTVRSLKTRPGRR